MQLNRVRRKRRTESFDSRRTATSIKETALADATVHPILQLHQAVGNQAVQRALRLRPIQTKLTVNHAGDIYEQEADRVADLVMRMPAPIVQRACGPCAAGGAPCAECQEEKEQSIHRKSAELADYSKAHVSDDFLQDLGAGQPLDSASRGFSEPRFGHDFSDVRVHTNSRAAESARAVNARAYTVGRDVVFGAAESVNESETRGEPSLLSIWSPDSTHRHR